MLMPFLRIPRLPPASLAVKSISAFQEGMFLNSKRSFNCTTLLLSSDGPDKQLPKIYTKTGDKGRFASEF